MPAPTGSGDARTRVLALLAAASAVAIMLLVASGATLLLETSGQLRRLTNRLAHTNAAAADLRLQLERMLATERAGRLALDRAGRADASAAFERAASEAHGLVPRLDPTAIAGRGGASRSAAALDDALGTAIARLRALLPASSTAAAAGPALPDDRAIVVPLERAIGLILAAGRRNRTEASDRLAEAIWRIAAIGIATIACFVVLLAFSLVRLVQGRARLRAAYRQEVLDAARLEMVLMHLRDGIAVFDNENRLTLRNARFCQAACVDERACAVGAPLAAFEAAFAGVLPDGLGVFATTRLRERMLEISRLAMPDGGQMLVVADVTHRVEAETIVRETQKLEVLGRLTGGIAHDFNNLLQALSANLEVTTALAREAPSATELTPRLQATTDGITRGIRLTRHLLAFARRQELAPVSIDLAPLLTGMADLFRRTLGDRIEVRLAIAADLWPVLGDQAQLENALLNIGLNARDAMPEGGLILLEAANVGAPDEPDAVRVVLTDTGVGMTADEIERAVEPFYTTKGEGHGTGLGLSLVHGYARESGGSFRLESEKGRGTRAILLLPRALDAPARDPVTIASPERGGGELLLLVEDDEAVRDATRATLEHLGYRVRTAVNADAAWTMIEAGLRPDLLFSDVMMPGTIDVVELVERARRLLPDLPVLLNTGDIEAPPLRRLALDARTALLGKPWRIAELSRLLSAVMIARSPAAPARAQSAAD